MKKIIIRNVDVIDSWETDFGDYQARVKFGENNKNIGDIIVSYERQKLYDLIGKKDYNKITKKEIEMAIGVLVLNEDFEKLKSLPKISKFSPLMQMIYDNICESDSGMCFIEEEDELCTMEDIERLKEEVKEFGLSDYITFNEDDCLVTGYDGIILEFIDDRML